MGPCYKLLRAQNNKNNYHTVWGTQNDEFTGTQNMKINQTHKQHKDTAELGEKQWYLTIFRASCAIITLRIVPSANMNYGTSNKCNMTHEYL